ncbi:MAG: tetratricopeptide repeat protein [Planctomycetaceae bacterium]
MTPQHIRARMFTFVMMAMGVWLAPIICLADATDDYNLALQLYKAEQWQPASDSLIAFLKANPDHEKAPNAQLYLGQALVHLRKFTEARPVFRDFVRRYSDHRDIDLARYRTAECSYFVDDFPTARKEFREFLDKAPPDHTLTKWALLYLGETELRLENMRDAADAFEQLQNQFGDSPLNEDARFGLARAYEALDRKQDAISLYRQLAENAQGARAADAQFNLSARLFEDQQFEEAASSFDTVVARFPESGLAPLAQLNAGFSRYHLGDLPAAIESFAKVQDDAKYGTTAQYWIGLSQKSLGQFDQAAETLLALYHKDENQPLAESMLFHAADSKLGAKAYDESMPLFLTVADKWPTGDLADDALHSAVEAALLAGKVNEAEQIRRRFVEQFPASGLQIPMELLHGRVLLARGDELAAEGTEASVEKSRQAYQLAADTLQKVLNESTIPQTQTMARLQLARAYDRLEDYEQLVKVLDPLASETANGEASEDHLRALVMQSNGWLALKNFDRTLESARRYLSQRPQGDDAGEAMANVALALANIGEWAEATETLNRLREANVPQLASRITYEVAELAYDAGRFEPAAVMYDAVVQQGADNEFFVPSVSGYAYSLHNRGIAELEAAKELKEEGEGIDGASSLKDAVKLLEQAAGAFAQLRELAAGKDDPAVEANAAYMQGLSLRLAKLSQQAVDVFLPAMTRFALSAEVTSPTEQQFTLGMTAFRMARDAARTFTEMGNTDEADKAYETAYQQLKLQPVDRQQDLDVLINEWALLHYGKDYDRSAELFALLIEERPESEWADDARYLIAENDFFSERWEPARDAFLAIIQSDSTDDFVRKKALTLLVDSAAQLDDWETVKSTAETLRNTYPDDKERYYAEYRIGESALRTGNNEVAEAVLSAVLEHRDAPELADANWLPSAWHLLAEAQLALKKSGAVDQTVTLFKQENPESPYTYQFDDVLGRRFKNKAQFDEARHAFQAVIDSKDGQGTETAAKAQFFIGETWLTQAIAIKDDAEKARRAYEEAFLAYYRVLLYDFPQWRAPALLQAGQCDEALQRWDGAKKSYQQLLTEYPETEYAKQASPRLEDLLQRFPETKTP